MSSFYGLEIARKSLFANQKAMEVLGHNIANANTEGYTRQRVNLTALNPAKTGVFSSQNSLQVGAGVKVESIDQIRDSFIDTQYRRELNSANEWDVKKNTMTYIEDIFSEPSEYGITEATAELFNSFEELSKDAESEQVRALVRQNAIQLTDTVKSIDTKLLSLQQEQDLEVQNITDEINSLANKIGSINEQIFKYELSGENANDLRDTRNLYVDELSGLVGVTAYEGDNGNYRVDINGVALVDHVNVNEVETQKTKLSDTDNLYYNEVYWKEAGNKIRGLGGELKGRIDIRDGNTAQNAGISYFISKLDKLAQSIVEEVNTANRAGYTLPTDIQASQTNIDFFNATGTNAGNMSISDELAQSLSNIAYSSEAVTNINTGNNGNADSFVSIRNKDDIETDGVKIGNIEDFANNIITELSVASSYNTKMSESQDVLKNSLEDQRKAISEVSIDEEMANMVTYQHSYTAASRVLSAMDEMLETLMGMVN